MKAKKQFGQHFLKSEKALAQIIATGDIRLDDIVLEIGPGTGVLTEKLLHLAGRVLAIEKDRELIPILQEKFFEEIKFGKLELLEEDILDFEPNGKKLRASSYKLIANIPYYITGAILEQFLSAKIQPERMVLLIQKEVAERIVAKDGKESILSLSVKAYGTPKIIDKVRAGAFSPPPKVDSAILLIKDISHDFFSTLDEQKFFEIVKTAFGQKRKTVGKTLGERYGARAATALATVGIDPKTRPEDIALDGWKTLCQALA